MFASTLFGLDFAVRYRIGEQVRLFGIALGVAISISVLVEIFFHGFVPTVDNAYTDAWNGIFAQKNDFAHTDRHLESCGQILHRGLFSGSHFPVPLENSFSSFRGHARSITCLQAPPPRVQGVDRGYRGCTDRKRALVRNCRYGHHGRISGP